MMMMMIWKTIKATIDRTKLDWWCVGVVKRMKATNVEFDRVKETRIFPVFPMKQTYHQVMMMVAQKISEQSVKRIEYGNRARRTRNCEGWRWQEGMTALIIHDSPVQVWFRRIIKNNNKQPRKEKEGVFWSPENDTFDKRSITHGNFESMDGEYVANRKPVTINQTMMVTMIELDQVRKS